jgi:hypothetical protein
MLSRGCDLSSKLKIAVAILSISPNVVLVLQSFAKFYRKQLEINRTFLLRHIRVRDWGSLCHNRIVVPKLIRILTSRAFYLCETFSQKSLRRSASYTTLQDHRV